MSSYQKVAVDLAEHATQRKAKGAMRFKTGLCHFVYEVFLSNNTSVVVRIASQPNINYLAGGLFWNQRLIDVGVPVAKVLASDLKNEYPHMILERLPGTDLGNVYHTLEEEEKRTLADQLMGIQRKVSTLDSIGKFGYALSYDDLTINGHQSWKTVLELNLQRSKNWISETNSVSPEYIDRTLEWINIHDGELRSVRPFAFLDDITTKNVIINNGKLTGIVDTDEICFGDSLCTIALTAMSLMARKWDCTYIEHLLHFHRSDSKVNILFNLYLLVFCVNFMAEIGKPFNGNNNPSINEIYRKNLERIFESTIANLKN